jgi:uncharacterized membrane protein YozB (DUF420 family)
MQLALSPHRPLTLPLWFYLSVTGVIVYFMVYQIYAAK